MNLFKAIVLGFIAGAIATLTAQEFLSWIFNRFWTGWTEIPWSKEMVPVFGDFMLPQVFKNMLTGGLWGSLFGIILGSRPQGPLTLRGMALGLVGPAILGAAVAKPLLNNLPPFFGGDVGQLIPALIVFTGFGAAAAWLYGAFRYRRLP